MPTGTSENKHYKKDSWRRRAKKKRKNFDPEHKQEEKIHPSEDDVTMKHPDNGSNIRITDSGAIRMFVDKETGVIIDPESQSIQVFGKRFKSDTKEFHVQCDEDRFMWNYMPLNPALKDPFTELMTANCIPSPIPFEAQVLLSGTEIFKEILTNPGTYVSVSPTTPGSANVIDTPAVGLEGKRAYKGIRELNLLKKGAEGIKEIIT